VVVVWGDVVKWSTSHVSLYLYLDFGLKQQQRWSQFTPCKC